MVGFFIRKDAYTGTPLAEVFKKSPQKLESMVRIFHFPADVPANELFFCGILHCYTLV
jgi:hypothetical protein